VVKESFHRPEIQLDKHICRVVIGCLSNLAIQDLSKYPAYVQAFLPTMLYVKTMNILKVKEKLGHKSVKNTKIYTHLLGEQFNME